MTEIKGLLPEGQPYFPEDTLTDQTERFIVAEIIREKIITLTRQELPYSTAVVVDEFKEDAETRPAVCIAATVFVEKDSQKGIMIGKGRGPHKEYRDGGSQGYRGILRYARVS